MGVTFYFYNIAIKPNYARRIAMNAQYSFSKFKQQNLHRKSTKFGIVLTIFLMTTVFLSGCGTILTLIGQIPAPMPEDDKKSVLLPVYGPELARETALTFIRTNYGIHAPPPEMFYGLEEKCLLLEQWDFQCISSSPMDGLQKYLFLQQNLLICVTL